MDNVTRRGFLGATAGAVGVATAIGEMSVAAAQDGAAAETAPGQQPKTLCVGMLTAPFGNEPLEKIADFAKQAQIACMEVSVDFDGGPIDVMSFDAAKADAVKKILADRNVAISALAFYGNPTEPDKQEQVQTFMKKMIDAVTLLGVPTICATAGFPAPRMTKINTIKKVLPKLYGPVIDYAAEKNVNIALENWFETNLQGLDTFEVLFETFADKPNFGLNYDPSHLVHQQCNYMLPVKLYSRRIFHTHAKDCLIDLDERGRVGVYGDGWWRYVIPGYGAVDWGQYISCLREARYSGVMSIEHEDSTFSREEGFIHGARFLRQFC